MLDPKNLETINSILDEASALRRRLHAIRDLEYRRLEGKPIIGGVRFLLGMKWLEGLIVTLAQPEDVLYSDGQLARAFLENQRKETPDILAGDAP